MSYLPFQCCRLCLYEGNDLIELFNEIKETLNINLQRTQKILEFTSISINDFDDLPKTICPDCNSTIEYFEKFKSQCRLSDSILKDRIKNLVKFKEDVLLANLTDIKLENFEIDERKNQQVEDESSKFENGNHKIACQATKIYNLTDKVLEESNKDLNSNVETEESRQKLKSSKLTDESQQIEIVYDNKESKHLKKKNPSKDISAKGRTPCHICGKLVLHYQMMHHQNIHKNIRPYVCDVEDCKSTFISPVYLRNHKKFWHTDFYLYKCEFCDKKFKMKGSYDLHKSYHLEPTIPCSLCGKLLRNKVAVKKHMLTHTGERAFKCDECEKSFLNKYTLNVHSRVHTKEKPFVCEECGDSFGYKCLLKAHREKYHLNENLNEVLDEQ